MLIVHVLPCCPRCHEEHRHLSFSRIAFQIENFEWYATCPATGQPILLRPLTEEESYNASTPQRPDYLPAHNVDPLIAGVSVAAVPHGTIAR